MSSMHADIADAIVTALNGEEFSQPFTAVKKYLPQYLLEDLATLRVSVIPSIWSAAPKNRALREYQYAVDIAVQKAIDPDTLAEGDAMVALMEEIDKFLAMGRLPGLTEAMWMKSETLGAGGVLVAEHLEEFRVFTGLLRVTWSVVE